MRNLKECIQLVQVGERNRAYAFTRMNAHSSRSHAVVIITVERRRKGAAAAAALAGKKGGAPLLTMKVGKLYLVDLAGSERLKKSMSEGQRASEAKAINLSLTTLGMCIKARASKDPDAFVPFRDSKLTRMLQESLGGNAKTSLIVCVPDAVEHLEETMSSLLFGQRAATVQTKARVNEVMDPDQFASAAQERLDREQAAREMLQAALFSKQEQMEALRAARESEQAQQKVKLRQIASDFNDLRERLVREQEGGAVQAAQAARLRDEKKALEEKAKEREAAHEALARRVEDLEGLNELLEKQMREATEDAERGHDDAEILETRCAQQSRDLERLGLEAKQREAANRELEERADELMARNDELRAKLSEAEDVEARCRRLEAELTEARALAEQRGRDAALLRDKLNRWQADDAERLRLARAARRIQRAWRRHHFRRMVGQIASERRHAGERAVQLQSAQQKERAFLLWMGAGLVSRAVDMVAESAEAVCKTMLLPEKDLRRHLQARNFTALGRGGDLAGSGGGGQGRVLKSRTPLPARLKQRAATGITL